MQLRRRAGLDVTLAKLGTIGHVLGMVEISKPLINGEQLATQSWA